MMCVWGGRKRGDFFLRPPPLFGDRIKNEVEAEGDEEIPVCIGELMNHLSPV